MAKTTCDIQIRFLPQKYCFCCDTGLSCTILIWRVSGTLSPELYVWQILSAGFLIKSLHKAQVLLFGLFWFWFYHLSTKELQNKRQNVKVSPGELRQRAVCFPAGRPCLMSHSPSYSPTLCILSTQKCCSAVCLSKALPKTVLVSPWLMWGANTLAFCSLGKNWSTSRPGE